MGLNLWWFVGLITFLLEELKELGINLKPINMIESLLLSAGYDIAKAGVMKFAGLFSKESIGFKTIEDFKEYDKRIETNSKAKIKIAKRVRELINEFFDISIHPILLDCGSVTYYISDELLKDSAGNIVTNSIGIHSMSATINTHPITVNTIPGEVNPVVGAYVGFQTAETAKQQLTKGVGKLEKSKVAVLGLRAYNPSKGFLENTPSLTDFQGTLFEHAENLIVVAQGEKFLNKAYAPILESSRFKEILDKRVKNKSLWFVYHEPTCKMTDAQKSFYNKNLNDFLSKIPKDRIINVSQKKN